MKGFIRDFFRLSHSAPRTGSEVRVWKFTSMIAEKASALAEPEGEIETIVSSKIF